MESEWRQNVADYGLTNFTFSFGFQVGKLTMCAPRLGGGFLVLGMSKPIVGPNWPGIFLVAGQPISTYFVSSVGGGKTSNRFPYGLVVPPDHP